MSRGSTKVYPNSSNYSSNSSFSESNNYKAESSSSSLSSSSFSSSVDEYDHEGNKATVLTVWKKSLIFNCNGYTVFDANGNLAFRVDNYMARHNGEIVLMDASGNPLLTIRGKKLSLGDTWLVYEGETSVNPKYSVRKHVGLLHPKIMAYVNGSSSSNSSSRVVYEIEGSCAQRYCKVLEAAADNNNSRMSKRMRKVVAEIKHKEAASGSGVAFGMDVFSLTVQPEIDTADAMAIVIILDQMFRSNSPRRLQ